MSRSTDSVYSALRRKIMAGGYAPGSQLKEEHIAEIMEVSRTPVRAALQRLVGDGLLRSESNRGVFVAEWTRWDTEDVFQLRLVLEPYAAAQAAEKAGAEDIKVLTSHTDQMEKLSRASLKNNLPGIQEANHAFHSKIIDVAGSARLKNMTSTLINMPMIVGSFYFYSDEDMRRSIQHHREILMAFRSKNPSFAHHAMTVHLLVTHEIYSKNMNHAVPGPG